LTQLSGLDQDCDLSPGRDGMGAKLAMFGCGKMLSMKMEDIADLAVG